MDRVPLLGPVWRLVRTTVSICLDQRVTGLAAEAGFFALLSLPPLVLGLAGTAALVGSQLGADTTNQLVETLREQLSPFLTSDVVDSTIVPTVEEALSGPRYDLISVGFVLSLWSGSRALNVLLDTISIMYGLGGQRGIVRSRALSLGLYVLGLGAGAVTLPLVLLGPGAIRGVLPASADWTVNGYWPLLTVLSSGLLATLYHVAMPVRGRWRRTVPGALLALVIWVVASTVMRATLDLSIGSQDGTSIYGPLTTPIILLVWLYLLAIAVLIGAGLNAAVERLWPHRDARGLTDTERVAEGT